MKEGASPSPSTKNFLNLSVYDTDCYGLSKHPYIKSFCGWGVRGKGLFSKSVFPRAILHVRKRIGISHGRLQCVLPLVVRVEPSTRLPISIKACTYCRISKVQWYSQISNQTIVGQERIQVGEPGH